MGEGVRCCHGVSVQPAVHRLLSLPLSPPDVEAVETRRAALTKAGGKLSCGSSTGPPANGSPSWPQHLLAPRSPAAEPRPAHLPHESGSAGGVWFLRVDGADPHLSPGED